MRYFTWKLELVSDIMWVIAGSSNSASSNKNRNHGADLYARLSMKLLHLKSDVIVLTSSFGWLCKYITYSEWVVVLGYRRFTYHKVLNTVLGLVKVPYDLFCSKVLEIVWARSYKSCGMYLPSKKAGNRNKKIHATEGVLVSRPLSWHTKFKTKTMKRAIRLFTNLSNLHERRKLKFKLSNDQM